MSQHEFEELVEHSVRLIDDRAEARGLDARSIFYSLFQFQNCWDTGFTHFRVFDELLSHRFVYRFKMEEHPTYTRHKRALDDLQAEGEFGFVLSNPSRPYDMKKNPVVGFFDPPDLFCEAGSGLWKKFVAKGVLTGVDAEEPTNLPVVDMARLLVSEAALADNEELIGLWYPLFAAWVCRANDANARAIKFAADKTEDLVALRQQFTDAKAWRSSSDYGMLKLPETEDSLRELLDGYCDDDDVAFLSWWYQPRLDAS